MTTVPGSQLQFLQSLSERELSERVLLPLFEVLGYENIRYTHGPLERGKDFVFAQIDPLEKQTYCAAVVKTSHLSGSVSKAGSIHEAYFQVIQALTEPYIDPFRGQPIEIAKVYVITSHQISSSTIESIKGLLQQLHNKVAFIDGPNLASLVSKYLPNLLTSLPGHL